MERAHPKRRFKARFFLIVLILLGALIAGIYYLATHPSRGRLSQAAVGAELEVRGVIIRNETTVARGEFYHIRYLVNEGDAVVDGQAVAEIFERGYDVVLADIVKTEQEVYVKQMGLLAAQQADGALSQNLQTLDNSINETVNALSRVSAGELVESYLSLERNLWDLLRARRTLLAELVVPDAALQNDLNRLQTLWNDYSQQSTLTNNAGSGYISFILDNFENALHIDQLSGAQVDRVLASTGTGSFATGDAYRIVAPNLWYIGVSFQAASGKRLVPGQNYEISADLGLTERLTGTVVQERISEGAAVYVLEVQADVMSVLSVRTMPITIHTGGSGTSIPLDGLVYENGIPHVYIWSGTEYHPIPVRIMASNDRLAIIEALDSKVNLHPGLRFQYYKAPSETPVPTEDPAATSSAPPSAAPTPGVTPVPTATADVLQEFPDDNL